MFCWAAGMGQGGPTVDSRAINDSAQVGGLICLLKPLFLQFLKLAEVDH